MTRTKYRTYLFLFALLAGVVSSLPARPVQAQVLTDTVLHQTILKALDNIYNSDFAEADVYIRQLRSRYPQHPAGPMLRAMQLYWQHIPLKDNKVATAQYGQACEQALTLARKRLEKDADDPEGVFFALTAHSYLALKYHNDDELMKAVNEARRAYSYMKQGFELTEKNPEFYFTTGLYNYYVERYPMENPIVKPMMWFFKSGNMPLGLRQMEAATRRATFTRHETAYYLANIYLQHESSPTRASAWLKPLVERFPDNPVFLMRYTESLLLNGQYDEAARLMPRLKAMPRTFLNVPIQLFEGLLAEKDAKNDRDAGTHYQAALRHTFVMPYTKEYHAMAYAGLARIAARANNSSLAKSYYSKALGISEYKSLQREAKAFK
ncbi:tetratricopeptide repeat protein [Rudanella lutea]|uniref:tetratricopeptide repeat protein n=1 Tax=Rudanella lutea TaxID=451374 RepID=UPI00035C6486|nr:hypothetical protein [Rudanella lutea]